MKMHGITSIGEIRDNLNSYVSNAYAALSAEMKQPGFSARGSIDNSVLDALIRYGSMDVSNAYGLAKDKLYNSALRFKEKAIHKKDNLTEMIQNYILPPNFEKAYR